MISLPTESPTKDHIGYVAKSPLMYDWYDSIFPNDEKMAKSTTLSEPFLPSSLPPVTKITIPRIYFWVKKTEIYNQYYLY